MGNYLEGNTVRRLDSIPEYTKEEREEKKRRSRRKQRRSTDVFTLVVLSTALLLCFFVCFSYLKTQLQVTYLSRNIVTLQNQVIDIKNQNDSLKETVDSSVNLADVYKVATQDLGMVLAKKSQIFYYNSQKSDQIKQYGEIPKKQR